jgi:hypothetical protein
MSLTANTRLTRRSWSARIPAGQRRKFGTACDWYTVDDLTAPILASVNGEDYAIIRTGENQQDPEVNRGFETIEFYNNTGAEVTVTLLYGFGFHNAVPRIEIGNAVELGDDTLLALNPPAVVGRALIARVVDATQNIANTYGITVSNIGAVNILVQGDVLAPGETVGWTSNGRADLVGNVEIDCETTPLGEAKAVYLAQPL